MNQYMTLLTAGGIAMTAMCGCTSGRASEATPLKDSAIFESFSYRGDDDYYKANPLPDESSYYNPILPGWYSDPTICTNGEGDYFLATSTFTYVPGVPIFHSRDLINWKQIGYVLTRESQLKNFAHQHVSGGIFAPDLKYNPANNTYYMITTNVGAGNFFVKSTDPMSGEWSDPIYLPEIKGIDPSFFFDNDGKAYIVNNDDAPDGKPEYPGHRTIRVVEFDTEHDCCTGERKIAVNKGWRPQDKPIWCEGPHIYNVDGKYYLMTAEGGTSVWHSEVVYRGDTPFGPYEPWSENPILTQRTLPGDRENPVTCAGHADLVKADNGQWWAVFLACRPIENKFENLGRETFMLPVTWTEDGWPLIYDKNQPIPLVCSVPGAVRNDSTATFGNFEWSDDFTAPKLANEWLTLRGDASHLYSLDTVPGHLTLTCADVATNEKDVLSFVGRRVQHHCYDCSTHMVFEPSHADQHAGLLVMKDEIHQYGLACCMGEDGCRCVNVHKVDENGLNTLASQPLTADTKGLDLKVVSHGKTLDFMYSTDRGEHWETLLADVDAGHTSTSIAGGFTGTVVGPYASNKK